MARAPHETMEPVFMDYQKRAKIMRVSKFLRWVLYIVGGFIAALLLIIILLSIIRIPIDLSRQRGMVASAASLALGRTVYIDDKIEVSTSLRPVFSLEGLRISNPKDFEEGDFLKMKTAEIRVHVLPLLMGKIKVEQTQRQRDYRHTPGKQARSG
jgi:uncharacterized protein involved in outer membrane biogenesis